MTTRNFTDIADLVDKSRRLVPTDAVHEVVIRRGPEKRVPFHRSKNSVVDALLIELYVTALRCIRSRSVRFVISRRAVETSAAASVSSYIADAVSAKAQRQHALTELERVFGGPPPVEEIGCQSPGVAAESLGPDPGPGPRGP